MSSALRCAVGSTDFFWIVVIGSPRSTVDGAGAGGGVDAGLDRYAAGGSGDRVDGGDRAVAQIADGALLQRHHTAEADAHPAAAGHQGAGGFGDVEQRGRPV